MRTIELYALSFIASPDEKRFILLRSKKAEDQTYLNEFAVPKIKIKERLEAHKIPGVWGTLGYQNDNPIDWTGTLECSNDGNDDFSKDSTVKDEVELLRLMYPDLKLKGDVKEKVVNLNQLEIPLPVVFELKKIPQLRLDVFLGPDEGALAFYQFSKDNNREAELEFIQPQETTGNKTDNRDRLTYFFNIIPTKNIEEIPDIPGRYRLSSQINEDDFIVKVLIFKRAFETRRGKSKIPTSSTEVVKLIEEKLAAYPDGFLVKDHVLKVFNSTKNSFTRAQPETIDPTKKTLLLLHGTFSSTKGSFKEVYGWIGSLVGKKKYEQVIAFDHPTLFYDAEMNINELFVHFKAVGIESFEKNVDIIGTSQGGLLAQYLANMNQSVLPVGKVALVASANGIDYLNFAQGLTTGLKLFRKVMLKLGNAPAALISALFQHSFNWVLKQPGLAVMKPGDERLASVIYHRPHLPTTRYLPVAGNYHANGLFKRRLELAIDTILEEENDWVIGTKNQFRAPGEYVALAGYNPGKYREFMINDSVHGSLIEKDEAQEMMEQFFFHESIETIDVSHKYATELFDSHCHVFGRDVISGRLILMLLGDLLDYFSKDNPAELLAPITLREENNDEKSKLSDVIRNIFKYFLFNKGGYQMLHDLEEEYYDTKSNIYRYIPLMFDLEMTFRNDYDTHDTGMEIATKMNEFKQWLDQFVDKLSNTIDLFEKDRQPVFKGSVIQNKESVRLLKYAKTILKGLELAEGRISGEIADSYSKQVEELSQLKTIYGADIFPFLAVDPRRPGIADDIMTKVGGGKTFHGIKIYTPNGYSPTDPHLFDKNESFVGGTCLYQWCIDNGIPILAHNSDAGFATFTDRLQVYGDICTNEQDTDGSFMLEYKNKESIDFRYNLKDGGFREAVKERAHTLNHPHIWRKVLNKFPKLKICFAHYGGDSEDWQEEIRKLIFDFENVYTDLSCQTSPEMLEKISKRYFRTDSDDNVKLRNRIMYGSDYFFNMLQGMKFAEYYNNFRSVFSEDQLKYMSLDVPKTFLGI